MSSRKENSMSIKKVRKNTYKPYNHEDNKLNSKIS